MTRAMSAARNDHTDLACWHGILPDEDAETLLKSSGNFMLRAVVQKSGSLVLVLSVRWGKKVLNPVITQTQEKSYKFQGNVYKTAKDLVDFHQVRKKPIIFDGIKAILDQPVRRKQWELRHKMIILSESLGSGSYGTVYKGTLICEQQKPMAVAVKALTEMNLEACNALWKEARVMRMYDHPNVVKYYGVANDHTPFYLVMELIEGGAVDQNLRNRGAKIKVKQRIQIIYEASMGIEYLHSKGCLHRDIASRNLLMNSVVKVADFGMTRKSKNYKIDPNKPTNLRWLAPEVFESGVVNKATDVYAFGVTMYECFTLPYMIPYSEWGANEVYDKVVVEGYRLSGTNLMPQNVADLMRECIGPQEMRPSFNAITISLEQIRKQKK